MTEDFGRSRGTDSFLIRNQFSDKEIEHLGRTRGSVDDDKLRWVAAGYWQRGDFPRELLAKISSRRSATTSS